MYQPHPIKRYLPKTLFGRALLIMIVPAVLVQLLAAYQFYERHWDSVVRNMSTALAGEVALLLNYYDPDSSAELVQMANVLGMRVSLDRSQRNVFVKEKGRDQYPEFYEQLAARLDAPFMVEQRGAEDDLFISILLEDVTLQLQTSKKRLVSSTTYVFLLWSAGASLMLLVVATLFLRNQIRPIRQLAAAAEKFGLGQGAAEFQPRGASEVRQAGRAFLIMRNRIERQVRARTDMLAGISHDLRTPLTRMKLQLAMLELDAAQQQELSADIEEMEHMIDEYLQFARGQAQEPTQEVALDQMLAELVATYQRHARAVTFQPGAGRMIPLRPKAMRRAFQNLIDNALSYGEQAEIETRVDGTYLVVAIRDRGPGIPEEKMEDAFRPFTRLDASRSPDVSGAGLGLSITRDIIQLHGGTIELRNRKTGLEVLVNLPMVRVTENQEAS